MELTMIYTPYYPTIIPRSSWGAPAQFISKQCLWVVCPNCYSASEPVTIDKMWGFHDNLCDEWSHSMLTVQCIAMGNWMLRKGSIIMAPLLLGFWPLPAWTAKVNSVATSLWYFWQTLMHLCLVSLEWRRLFNLWRCTTVITSAHRWRAWKHWRFCYKEHSASRHCVSNYTWA